MPPRKQYVQSTEVRVYKDDGVWWAEIDDPNYGARSTFTTGPETFIAKAESMVLWLDVDPESIQWTPHGDAAKKFLNRARKLHANGSQSDQDDSTEDEDLDDSPADD